MKKSLIFSALATIAANHANQTAKADSMTTTTPTTALADLPKEMSWLDAPHDIASDKASAWARGWNACLAALARRAAQPVAPVQADARSLLERAHRVISCAAIAQIRDGEATWEDIGKYLATPSPQIAEVAELPPLRPMPKPHMRLSEAEGSDDYPVFLTAHMQSYARDYARDAIAASRRAAGGEVYGYHYEWASCITTEGPQHFRWKFDREAPPEWAVEEGQARNVTPLCKIAAPAPASAGQAAPAEQALLKLCDQLDGMKRRLLHTPGTGQHHSYLMHEDVEAYVEEARKSLAAQPAEGAGQAGQVAKGPDQQQIEWSNDLQGRLIDLSQDMTESEDARQVMAEAACLLASLTGHAVSQ